MKTKPTKFVQKEPESRLEKIEQKKLKRAIKTAKISFYIVATLLVILGAFSVYDYINTHSFRSPVLINFQSPVVKNKQKIISPLSSKVIKKAYAEEPRELSDEEYIKQKFGDAGDIAVAVVKAESGIDKKVNPNNSNGSVDIGCMQINSIHLKKAANSKEAYKLLETFMDCKKAVDWAYENLYVPQGFNPWVAYTSGAYLSKM